MRQLTSPDDQQGIDWKKTGKTVVKVGVIGAVAYYGVPYLYRKLTGGSSR